MTNDDGVSVLEIPKGMAPVGEPCPVWDDTGGVVVVFFRSELPGTPETVRARARQLRNIADRLENLVAEHKPS